MPMTGTPTFIAMSMALHIFLAWASPSEPPITVKSWAKTKTWRPSTVPWPMTTPSPGAFDFVHPELRAAVLDEGVELEEAPRIEEGRNSFASRDLALLVLSGDALRSAPFEYLAPTLLEPA